MHGFLWGTTLHVQDIMAIDHTRDAHFACIGGKEAPLQSPTMATIMVTGLTMGPKINYMDLLDEKILILYCIVEQAPEF